MAQKPLKLSDSLLHVANSVVGLARIAGLEIKVTQVYTKETVEALALLSGLLRQLAEKAAKTQIETVNQ